jgi:predicted O-linked N-acetylglucosamine transferase (SPINDLY family)
LALATLQRAESIAPQAGARSMRASVAGRLGEVDKALAIYADLAQEEGPLSKMRSSAAMVSLYSDQFSASAIATLHRELFEPLGEGARQPKSFSNTREPNKRLRLGLVTADFHHQHPVNIFMQPVLARWNPEDIEITVYFTGISYPGRIVFPADERSAYTAAAVILAADAISQATPASKLFLSSTVFD